MIGRLTGVLDYKGLDHVLLDVRGVGYIVYVSDRTLMALPPVGEVASLHTELLVREDLLQLFGFLSASEREWHRLLTSVQGIGAKASMAILGTLGAEGVSRAISLGDAAAIKAAPGVGPKIAARVVNELKDKAPKMMALIEPEPKGAPLVASDDAPKPKPAVSKPTVSEPNSQAEALSALTNLGYAAEDAARAVAQAQEDGGSETASIIRLALKRLAPKD